MHVGVNFRKLRETTPLEMLSRFAFGGAVTVVASLVARRYGPVIGGLFLAFPGIFPPSLSLTEKHAEKRKAAEGKVGTRFGRAEASVESAGASAGALGLAAFALVIWKGVPGHGILPIVVVATAAWALVSTALWRIRERL
jgi:hypothetical protein